MEASIGHHLSTSAGSRIITEEAFVRVDALFDPAERGTGGDRRLVGYSTFGGFVLGCIEADFASNISFFSAVLIQQDCAILHSFQFAKLAILSPKS